MVSISVLSRINFSWFFRKSILFLVFCIVVVMILNSNFQMGLLKGNLMSINTKIIIFSSFVITFIASGLVLLNLTNQATETKATTQSRIYSLSMFLIFLILSTTLIATTIQMALYKSYSRIVFYVTSYLSFISSLAFLSILSLKFLQLFLTRRHYLTLSYGILFSIYCCTILLLLLYTISGLATHPSVIRFVPPRELIGGTYLVNVIFQNNVARIYDILFLISFILAWIVSIVVLKQYIHRIGKYKFWLLVSIPLLFHLIRYGTIFNLGQFSVTSGTNIIPSSIGEGILISLFNSDIQISGVFFALPFLIIALKLNYQLRQMLIITVIGMMLLFGARDLHSVFVSSIPPAGVVTISFMCIGSFMLLTGLISFLRLATRDKQLYRDLARRIGNDDTLLKNLILSEQNILTMNLAKPLIDFSNQWQKKHSHEELSMEEIKEIVHDVTLELKNKKLK